MSLVIMPLGDSITQGTNSTDGAGYRTELFRRSVVRGKDITFVGGATPVAAPATVLGRPFPPAHEGHIGFRIAGDPGGISSLVAGALRAFNPDIALFHIGTNDIPHPEDIATAPTRLGGVLDLMHITAPKLLIVLCQIIPSGNGATNGIISNYNAAIPALVQARASFCQLADMFDPFISQPQFDVTLLSDGTHPSDAGYAKMGEVFFNTLFPGG